MLDAATWQIISIVGYSLAGVLLVAAIVLSIKMNIPALIGDLTGKTAARQIQEIRERNTVSGNKHHKPEAFNFERGTLTELVRNRTGKSRKIGKTAQGLAHASKRLDLKGKTEENSAPIVKETVRTEGIEKQVTDGLATNVFTVKNTNVLVGGKDGSTATEVLTVHTKVLNNGIDGLSDGTEILGDANGTEILAEVNGTEVLLDGTEVLAEVNGTEVLSNGTEILAEVNGTEVLSDGPSVHGFCYGTEVLSQDDGTTVLYPTAELEDDHEKISQVVEFKIVKDIKVIHTSEVI